VSLKIGELYGELNLDRAPFTKGLAEGGRQFEGFGKDLLGKAAGLAAGLGLTMGAVDIVKKIGEIGISFQDMGNTFQAVSGATSAQMAEMGKRAIDLGNDLSLPTTSATDAEAAMVELAKGGLSVADSMAAAKGVLELSTAAQVDTATAATYAADALNTFHLRGSDAVMVADLLAGAANASSGGISDMALSLQQAGSVFAAAHVPIADVVTLISEMAQNGIRGSDAGTSLKTMMLALQTPSKQQAVLMKELNIQLYDNHGAMRNFRDIIADTQGPLSKLTQAQRDHALGVIFGSDAVRAGNIILGGGVTAFDNMRAAVTKQGSAADVAAAQSKGLGGAVRGLQSQLETLGLQIFQQVSPELESFARGLSDNLPKAVEMASSFLGQLQQTGENASKFWGPLADQMGKNMQRAIGDSKPMLEGFKKDWDDLLAGVSKFAKSEMFAEIVATMVVLLPAALDVTIAHLGRLNDQFRVVLTSIGGFGKTVWDISQGDYKAAWEDMQSTAKDVTKEVEQLSKDEGAIRKAEAHATSAEVSRNYEEMKNQVLVSMNGMKEGELTSAGEARIAMGQAALATGQEYSGGLADGMRAGGTRVTDAATVVVGDAVARAHDAAASSYNVGAFLAQGMALGLADNSGFVSSAAVAATRNAMHEAQANAKIQSPSRLWADEIGGPLAAGIAHGILGGRSLVASAARGLVDPFTASLGAMQAPTMAMAAAGSAPAPAASSAVHVNQHFHGQTADHRQMFADAAWDARRLR
jgi:TP901 family phage tail tape measure protein